MVTGSIGRRRLSFGALVFTAFSLLASVLGLLGWTAVQDMNEASTSLRDVYVNHVVPSSSLNQVMPPMRDISFRMAGFMASELPAAGCKGKLKEAATELRAKWAEFQSQANDLSEDGKVAVKLVSEGLSRFEAFEGKLGAAYGANDAPAVTKLFEDELPAIQSGLFSPIQKLVEAQQVAVRVTYEGAMARASSSRKFTYSLIGIGLLMVIVSIGLVVRMSSQLAGYASKAQHLGRESESLGALSSGFLDSSQALAQASTEQTSALESTRTAMTQMDESLKTNAASMEDSVEIAQACHESTVQGQKAVGRMLESIEQISTGNTQILGAVENGNRKISEIVKVIEEIGSKTKVINDIVFQTKLLSFNASVEAARAGEHGKGFAVVAEEIGTLAQMSGSAAREISTILESSISRVKDIVTEMGDGIQTLVTDAEQRTKTGKSVASECAQALKTIVSNVAKMSQAIESVAVSIREQSQAVSSVSGAITDASSITHRNSSQAGQIANAAEELAAKSTQMRSLVQELSSLVQSAGQEKRRSEREMREAA